MIESQLQLAIIKLRSAEDINKSCRADGLSHAKKSWYQEKKPDCFVFQKIYNKLNVLQMLMNNQSVYKES